MEDKQNSELTIIGHPKKVYCRDCRYFVRGYSSFAEYFESTCRKQISCEDTPICVKPIYASFEENNKDNHCPYYEPNECTQRRRWWQWWK